MHASGLNTKYKQLKEYMITINLMAENPRLWISDANLEHLTNTLFNVIKLNNDDDTYKAYLKLTYALLYYASNAMTMKDIDFDTALVISYKRAFNVKSVRPIDMQMTNILYEQDILIKPDGSYIDDDYFIQVENTTCIGNETHMKYKDDLIVVSSSQKNEYTVTTQRSWYVWYNVFNNTNIDLHDFDKYLKWLSDDNQQKLLFILFSHIDIILENYADDTFSKEVTTYLNNVKQILIKHTNIPNIDKKIDTAIILNMQLTPLIDQLLQPDINPVELPDLELNNY